MASVASLREHLVEELNDLLSAERQLIDALPKMAELASTRELKTAFRSHLSETRTHERRIQQALQQLGERPNSHTCEAMEGLLAEGEDLMNATGGGALRDAMMITAAQKVEHYEIATYGTVRTYAKVLGERGVATLMNQNLQEEKAADRKLTNIAEGLVNRKASKEWHEKTSAADMLEQGAEWVGSAVGAAAKTVRSMMPDARTVNTAVKTVRNAMPAPATVNRTVNRTAKRVKNAMPDRKTARRVVKSTRSAMPRVSAADRPRKATKGRKRAGGRKK